MLKVAAFAIGIFIWQVMRPDLRWYEALAITFVVTWPVIAIVGGKTMLDRILKVIGKG